ncbi:MAG: septum site-determining protein MinC [Lachnospiraceae bacterium]|nr:septum site-determining protein MinC [Lachnospiraceae bacterium]MCD7842071.1 septum site-determining protein MinC [Lachnospiraceae bacterium]
MDHKQSAVILKSNPYGLIVNLSPDLPFEELLTAAGEKFRVSAGFFKNARLALTFRGRDLTREQEAALVDTIVQNSSIQVVCIVDEEKETAEYYRRALTHALEKKKEEDGHFYRGTLHRGESLESETSLVILGDINPGAQVTSKGNLVVLGCCMGSVYAGAGGDENCFIAALTLKPSLLKIAGAAPMRSAIVKTKDPGDYPVEPEMAFVKDGHLLINSITKETLCEYLA